MKHYKFTKWQGLGNDFVIIDLAPDERFDARSAIQLCDRHFGIGADGVATLRQLNGNAYEMRIYNSDGSEPEMCGNATRCVGMHLGRDLELHTKAGIIRPKVLGNGRVRVDMGTPKLIEKEACLRYGEREFTACRISMGNPHAVIFVPDIQTIELETWGAAFECDPMFPDKTNVEFVEVINPGLMRMRVWERGCGVTMACGTGSCAAGVAGVLTGRTSRNVTVLLDGGELAIEYFDHVFMTGPATEVFRGECSLAENF